MMIPGIIAYHMYGPELTSIDEAYPALIRDVFPIWMMGFFLAVLFGAVFSSFNSLLNSAATMFTLDIYAPMRRAPLTDRQAVRMAMIASVVIALFSFSSHRCFGLRLKACGKLFAFLRVSIIFRLWRLSSSVCLRDVSPRWHRKL